MNTEIAVALIAATSAIIVALINSYSKNKSSRKSNEGRKTIINQSTAGNHTTQIGIHISGKDEDNSDR